MDVRRAIITAAGDRERRIPLQTLVDTDGVSRTILAMLVAEAASAGAEEVGIVVPSGQAADFRSAVPEPPAKLTFFEQVAGGGYAGALLTAAGFLANEPFLHLVGDHVYVNGRGQGLAQGLVRVASENGCSVSAVQPTHESHLARFGVIGGTPVADGAGLYQIDAVIEKPTPTEAEVRLIVAGLRAGYYLAFFGMHVWTPAVLALVSELRDRPAPISAALDQLGSRERYLAWAAPGHRYDLGPRYGLLNAQLALSLAGHDREEVLASLVSLIATHGTRQP